MSRPGEDVLCLATGGACTTGDRSGYYDGILSTPHCHQEMPSATLATADVMFSARALR